MVYQRIDDQWLPLFRKRHHKKELGFGKSHQRPSTKAAATHSHRFRQNPLQKNYQEQNPNHGREMATSCHGKKVTWAHNPTLVKQKSILQGTKCNKNSFPNRGTKNWITKRNISYRKAKRPPQDSETGQPTQISNLNRSVRNHFITLVTFTTMTVTNPRHRIPTLVIRIPQNTLWIIRVVTSLS